MDIEIAWQFINPKVFRSTDPGYPVNSANWGRLRYRHVSFRPSAAQCRNLIFSGTCPSLGDSGLPLRGNRNDGADAGTCCAQTKWGAGNYSLLISGFRPGLSSDRAAFSCRLGDRNDHWHQPVPMAVVRRDIGDARAYSRQQGSLAQGFGPELENT